MLSSPSRSPSPGKSKWKEPAGRDVERSFSSISVEDNTRLVSYAGTGAVGAGALYQSQLIGTRKDWKKCKSPSEWTVCHTLWLVLLGWLLPTALCFASNFGVAFLVYDKEEPPTMWKFPIPLAGQLAMIVLIQQLANYTISGNLQVLDVLNGLVAPLHSKSSLSSMWPDQAHWPMLHWFFLPTELLLPPRDEPFKSLLDRLKDSLKRAAFWVVVAGIPAWPLAILTVYLIYPDSDYGMYSRAEFCWISAAFGGILAFIFMPIWALGALIYMGRRISEEETRARMSSSSLRMSSLDLVPYGQSARI